jgi:formylglycine-generating enzyme required for sulfatase activity
MNRLSYLWVALFFFWFSACTRTEQSVTPDGDQTQELSSTIPLSPAESPFPSTDPPRPPLIAPLGIDQAKAYLKARAEAIKASQTQDLPSAESPFPPTDQPQPPLIAPLDSEQAKSLQKAWADHLGIPVQITNAIGMTLNLIPPGEFVMGIPVSEVIPFEFNGIEFGQFGAGIDHPASGKRMFGDDARPHLVNLSTPFYLSVHEVTQSQYEQVMGKNPSFFSASWKGHHTVMDRLSNGTSQFPVEQVSWNDVVAFCGKLSDKEGNQYRLPTEAEWEYACYAGTTTTYSFGDDASGLGEYAWHGGNSGASTHPVGQLKPNAWGLFDMHGNVGEWCQDSYPRNQINWLGEGPTSGKVLRGKAFNGKPMLVRAANYSIRLPDIRRHDCGFRLARTVSLSP